MAISRSYLFLAALLILYSEASAQVVLASTRTLSEYHVTKVLLLCSSSPPTEGTAVFYRRLGSDVDRVIANTTGTGSGQQLSFDLTPEREGYYYCEVGNTPSNEVELVATPAINPEINAQRMYATPTGSDAIIHCLYKAGSLIDKYAVTWNRGLTPIDFQAPEFSRFSVLDNFSLVIENTVPDDAKAYSCNLVVNITGDLIRKYGPAVSLEVTDPIRITQSISDIAILPGQDAVFRCTAVGVPQAQIKWLIGNAEVQGNMNPVVTSTPDSITAESSLRLTTVEETQTGPVSCVAYHSYDGELYLATSTANLVVLTNNFTVSLTPETNGNVRIQTTLPAVIPGVFSLVVQFIFNLAIVQQREIIHPSFKNTRIINLVVPDDQLPQFRQFRVRVALKFDDVQGELSPKSEKITLPDELPSSITGGDCECPILPNDSAPATSDTTTHVLIGIFIALVVILVIVGAVLLGFCVHMYKREPVRAMTASSVYYHEKTGSLTRSVSRASYNSESSRSSGRSSRSRGSHSSRSSRSSHSSYGASRSSSRTWSQGDLESVKEDYSERGSLKHKDLSQWGTLEKESVSSPVSPEPCPPAKSPYEELEFQPPQSREEVFHTSLPHCTNPIQFTIKYEKKKLRHSDSSYEDMQLDETPIQVPFQTK